MQGRMVLFRLICPLPALVREIKATEEKQVTMNFSSLPISYA